MKDSKDEADAPADLGNSSHDLGAADAEGLRPTRIVAIGASAGGLEPIEQLFDNVPNDLGMAYVVIQHLSPDFRSMMDELLARHSTMPIKLAQSGLKLQPNTIYLNPPRKEMLLQDGTLWLQDAESTAELRLPINTFMHSLAIQEGEHAVGIILSGTGSDGSKGAADIRSAGGTVIVQHPDSAKFDGMPRAAMDPDGGSLTSLPTDMGALLKNLRDGITLKTDEELASEEKISDPQARILRLIERRYAVDFSYYRLATVDRRIQRRTLLSGLQDISSYADLCRTHPEEIEKLYCDLLIGVTAFFRDTEIFDILRETYIPRVCEKMSSDKQIRIWIPGCATGEEPYSLAILISEFARRKGILPNAKIFATDIHFGSLEIAGRGEYPASALRNMPEDYLERYFTSTDDYYRVTQDLRSLIVFSNHNLIRDPPFTRMDMVSCRNLLIYFNHAAQRQALALMHFALNKDGTMVLGASETPGDLAHEFTPLDQKWRIYAKTRDVRLAESTRLLPMQSRPREESQKTSILGTRGPDDKTLHYPQPIQKRFLLDAYDAMLRRYAPPSMLVGRAGEILHVFGDGRKYIDIPDGVFSPRIADIVREPLKVPVSIVLDRVKTSGHELIKRDAKFIQEDGTRTTVTVMGEPFPANGSVVEYILITFQEEKNAEPTYGQIREINASRTLDNTVLTQRIQELERDLQFTEESLQSTIEELETSNEEMQASNEELMAANEELQSTNEELHSVNEELFTISSEHHRKIDELTEVTTDMEHLLRNTDIGTLFLDEKLRIRRFTPTIARSFNLLDRDVGRPLEDITSRFSHPTFFEDVRKVVQKGERTELEVGIEDGSYLMRILPYRTPDSSEPKGAVITLVDVTRLKQVERSLAERNHELARVNDNLEQFTYIVSHDLRRPLRAIRNSAQWIEEDLKEVPSDDVRGHLDRLRNQTASLSDMLKELLEYSRLGSEEQHVESINLNFMVRDIAGLLDYDTDVELSLAEGLPSIDSHRAPLRLVLQNLIDNAAKYSDHRTAKIRIRTRPVNDGLVFLFSDDGPGIAKEHHDKIFLPFRKLEHLQFVPGTGMGLALVRKAVETRGGSIKVKSDPNRRPGTTFLFFWPYENLVE